MIPPTMEECVAEYSKTPEKLTIEIHKLQRTSIPGSIAGNSIIYHYFQKARLKTRVNSGYSCLEWLEENKDKHYVQRTIAYHLQRGVSPVKAWINVLQLYSQSGSISVFKPALAKYIILKYSAKCVLDPCMGWGGRLLGTMMAGDSIRYMGIDTNPSLVVPYSRMIDELLSTRKGDIHLLHSTRAETIDFASLPWKYDFVLTSPPYWSKKNNRLTERYEGMIEWKTKTEYLEDFLKPLIMNLWKHLEYSGRMCINLPRTEAEEIVKWLGGIEWEEEIPLGLKKQKFSTRINYTEAVYVWRKWLPPPQFPEGVPVVVKKSTIPDAGNGLFASSSIAKGTRIASYEGEMMTLSEFKKHYGTDYRFSYPARRIHSIRCGKKEEYLTKNPSHYANEGIPNICLRSWGLYALRNLTEGEELFLAYPKEYPRTY